MVHALKAYYLRFLGRRSELRFAGRPTGDRFADG